MKFLINHIGPIEEGSVELGKLTVLCGKNNSGKTYVAYNLYNYIKDLNSLLTVDFSKELVAVLFKNGQVNFDLVNYSSKLQKIVDNSMRGWSVKEASRKMAAHEDHFANASFSLELDEDAASREMQALSVDWNPRVSENCTLVFRKKVGSGNVSVVLQNGGDKLPAEAVIVSALKIFTRWCLCTVFPKMFIITCERTGVAVFRSLLANKLKDSASNNLFLVSTDVFEQNYPLPVCKDIAMMSDLASLISRKSYFAESHPDVISAFDDIAGGAYSVLDKDVIQFTPRGSTVALSTVESSSSARSLMEIGFYLRHLAKSGECLMIDEPEQNLHPEMQRKMARLIVRIVNCGIKVFVTTHSDYIIREFNTLLMFKSLKAVNASRATVLLSELGYSDAELLDIGDVRAYCLRNHTIEPMPTSQEMGIQVDTFDDTIRAINNVQSRIMFGAE